MSVSAEAIIECKCPMIEPMGRLSPMKTLIYYCKHQMESEPVLHGDKLRHDMLKFVMMDKNCQCKILEYYVK